VVIDTSAILAWLKGEPERERIVAAIEANPVRRVSAVSLMEAHIVIQSRERPDMISKLHAFLEIIDAIIVPFDESQAHVAAEAFRRYGKGQKHPAQLNMGDCAVYALAKQVNEPLLFIGSDFGRTDLMTC
jgi:ribonuclease VapC